MNPWLFLLLATPLTAAAATPELASFDCKSMIFYDRPSEAEQVAARHTEKRLADGDLASDLLAAQEMQTLALTRMSSFQSQKSDEAAEQALAAWRKLPETAALVQQLHQAANRYHRRNMCKSAAPVYELALAMSDKLSGPHHASTFALMTDLAHLYRAQRQLPQLEKIAERVLAAGEMNPSAIVDIARAHKDLSEVNYRRGTFPLAEKHALAAVALHEKTAGKPLALALNELAAVYYAQRRFAEGEAARNRAKSITDVIEVNVMTEVPPNISNLYGKGDIAGAIALASKALADEDAAQVPLIAKVYEAEQELKADAGVSKYPEMQRSIALENLRRSHVQVARALCDLGELFHSQQQLAEAEPLYRRAIALLDKDPRAPGFTKARLASNLGLLTQKQGAYAEALQLQQKVLEFYLPLLGSEHPDVIETQAEVAYLHKAQGKLAESQSLYEALLANAETQGTPEREPVSEYLTMLAEIAHAQQDALRAEGLHKRVVSLWSSGGKRSDVYLVSSLKSLSAIYRKLNRPADMKAVDLKLAALKPAK
ncbi:tetratricopeptide repeat protein [Massilia glaciei]|uniref:Tetratricopeptide repeat protein n=1 Tax=Massilia glaciei TaxID=1524097 RepID=A0A2U2HP63_9BURK|nr:tetratricopeptide repeat protein [Massilia glaciei]PWF49297.1 tetratricopeptide repeat protein [Massilia glaciei]